MIPEKPEVEMRKECDGLTPGGMFLIAIMLVPLVVLFLSGCTGPSRARYAELLHECRERNREQIRIIKEYDSRECVVPVRVHTTLENIVPHPEQSLGSIELGLGGY